jgi:ABC-type lipoprotein export system ATPase subunit
VPPRQAHGPSGCSITWRSVISGIVMNLLRKVAIDQDAAIITETHDDKIFDRFDKIFQLRDGALDPDGSQVPPRSRRAAQNAA